MVGSSGGFSFFTSGAVKIGTRHSGLQQRTSLPPALVDVYPGVSHMGQTTSCARPLDGSERSGTAPFFTALSTANGSSSSAFSAAGAEEAFVGFGSDFAAVAGLADFGAAA